MWPAELPEVAVPGLSLEPVDVLYSFEGPRIFTCRDDEQRLFLAYVADESESVRRLLVVPTSPRIVEGLLSGQSSVRQALDQPWLWVVDESSDGALTTARLGDLSQVPEDFAPRPGVPLLAEHRPLLSVRLVGPELGPQRVVASVVRRAVDGVLGALKILTEQATDVEAADGRPRDSLRRLYDLPVREVRFASFEISLADPRATAQEPLFGAEDAKALDVAGEWLRAGLTWLVDDDAVELDEARKVAILEALAKLVPPSQGVVQEVQVGGLMVGSRASKFVLTRHATTRVRAALRAARSEPELKSFVGRVRELDKDKLSFQLRDDEGVNICRCSFPEELSAEIETAFVNERHVAVAGRVASPARAGMRDVEVISLAEPEARRAER
jgi:hypothetical protein